jgi:iron complex outermembrane recepter protein
MTSNALLRRAVRYALYANAAAASVGLPAVALAQAAPPPPSEQAEAAAPISEVVVTGSRIVQPGLQAISPVTSVSQEEIKSQGVTRIEDLINSLPQVVADQGSMASNGASGTAEVDLRGLGPQRTLVLINGRRLVPGTPDVKTPSNLGADLNNIPAALVERVDVLTGGASAVYGADATAGVVNFIMNDHFQGFRIDANADMYNHSQHNYYGQFPPASGYGSPPSTVNDGKTKDITFILGGNFADGKGNATAYVGYRRVDAVLQSQRDFSRCSLDNEGGQVVCGGSSTAATGRIFGFGTAVSPPGTVPPVYGVPFQFFTGYPNAAFGDGATINPKTGQIVPWVDSDAFNYGALNYYQRPDERWTGGVFAHYNWDEHHEMYTEFMFMSDHTLAQIAPSGMFLGAGGGVIPAGYANAGSPDGLWETNCSNPLLSAQELSVLCGGSTTGNVEMLMGRRNVEGGDRTDDLTHTSYRLVVGSKGELTDMLSYDAYAMEGMTLLSDEYLNDVSLARLTNALLVGGTAANPVCLANAGGANGAPGCVPYNIWGTGAVNPAAVKYFTVPGFIEGETEERVVSGNVTADMTKLGVKMPTATTGLIVNIGAEYRQEFEDLRPDVEFQGNGSRADLNGQGSATLPLSAGFQVWEGFLEARMPLLQDLPFTKELSIEAGYRYSSYTVGFDTNTYKFGVDWAPVSDVRLRASYNRAVRVPNLTELFSQKFVGLDGSADPCATTGFGSPATATLAQCTRRAPPVGMTPAQYNEPGNPAGQYNGLLGGNPKLQPEVADTYTFGIVLTPTALPTFNMTLDYFDIKIKNIITSYGANFIVDQCVVQNNPFFCSSTQEGEQVGVHRDVLGSIWFSTDGYVEDPLLNLGYLWTRGVDLGAHYRQDLGWLGHMDFSLAGTYTASSITEPYPGSGFYDCAGYYGATCGNPLPKWRHVFSDTWATPIQGLDFMARWRHLNSTKIDVSNSSPLLAGAVNPLIANLGSRDYLDLMAMYAWSKGITVRLGVNNVLDKDPPILPTTTAIASAFFNGNTYPQVYDTLGRYLFLNVTIDF